MLNRGARARSGAVVASVGTVSDDGPPLLGLIIGRGVGTSVQRHRAARILRHAVRERVESLPHGTAVVLRVLPGRHGGSRTLADDARRALDRAASRR